MTRVFGRFAALCLLGALALPLSADDDPAACPAIDRAAADPARTAGLLAFRDQATGLLRQPTAEEAAALARAAAAQAAPESQPVLEVIVHPDGMKTLDLKGRFEAAVVATRNPDGTVALRCVPAAAAAALPPALPARPALEEK